MRPSPRGRPLAGGTRDGQDVYSWTFKALVKAFGWLARVTRFAELDDQVEAWG